MSQTTKTAPRHVAITMDGNGRWATKRGRPRTFGHHRGAERVREVVRRASDIGIEALTLFAFSTENWRRPDYEVKVLMRLFKRYIIREVDGLDAEGVQVRFIGDRERLPIDLQRVMGMMEERTADNDGMILQLAISYGSRAEILRGVRALAEDVAAGRLDPSEIDEGAISGSLHTAGVPDPDLMIRTSGEYRISNFLLWQAAYAEFVFVEENWPDFTPDRLEELVMTFGSRERRFGAVRTG
ncbi:MAG: isoprenyl transferase [Pseudomonadota bacterium]